MSNAATIKEMREQLDWIERIVSKVPDDSIVTIHSLYANPGETKPRHLVSFHEPADAFAALGRDGWEVQGDDMVKLHDRFEVSIYLGGRLGRVLGYPLRPAPSPQPSPPAGAREENGGAS